MEAGFSLWPWLDSTASIACMFSLAILESRRYCSSQAGRGHCDGARLGEVTADFGDCAAMAASWGIMEPLLQAFLISFEVAF